MTKPQKNTNIRFFIALFILFLSLLILLKVNIDSMLTNNAEVKKLIELSYKKHLIDLAIKDNLIPNHSVYQNKVKVYFNDNKITNEEILLIDKIYDEEISSIPVESLELLLVKDLNK